MKKNLSSINLLDELKKSEYDTLRDSFAVVSYSKGQLIYAPGHTDDLVFIVKTGRLRVYLAMEDKEFSLGMLDPGDVYTSHTRAHVTAEEEATLLTLPSGEFHRHMITYPAFSRTIVSILGEMLKQSFSIIDNLVFKDITSRLTDFLFYEAEHNGHTVEGGTLVHLDLTMEQLAALVGSSRQTVSTIINSMLRDNVIQKSGRGKYLVPDLGALRKINTFRSKLFAISPKAAETLSCEMVPSSFKGFCV